MVGVVGGRHFSRAVGGPWLDIICRYLLNVGRIALEMVYAVIGLDVFVEV